LWQDLLELFTFPTKNDARTTTSYNGLKVEHLSSKEGLHLRMVEFPSGASMGEPNAHQGVETHFVLEGVLLAEQGEDRYNVEEGDSFSWNACVPHYVKNIGDGKAVVLIAVYSDTELKGILG
jgi:quercetin dioxygenase-like cupin family protein